VVKVAKCKQSSILTSIQNTNSYEYTNSLQSKRSKDNFSLWQMSIFGNCNKILNIKGLEK
jgi:hypothetical protein